MVKNGETYSFDPAAAGVRFNTITYTSEITAVLTLLTTLLRYSLPTATVTYDAGV
jgi:hypothetical protein